MITTTNLSEEPGQAPGVEEGEGAVAADAAPAVAGLLEAGGAPAQRVPAERGVRRGAGFCGRRTSGYDRGAGRRRWRSLDLGAVRCLGSAPHHP